MEMGIRETPGKIPDESEFDECICHTDEDIRRYIMKKIPGITYEDMWKIRCRYIYGKYQRLDTIIENYKHDLQMKEWNKSKDKKYWRIFLPSGSIKFVCMCEEHVKYLYPGIYEEV